MARILGAWSPNWAIESWRRRNPCAEPAKAPFALVEKVKGARRLYAVDAAAQALGLHPGQKAADALALAPDLVLADAEPQADARALTALGDWCVRFSPAVATDPPDGLFLDVGGADHLWGGEAAMLADLRLRLARAGHGMRLAIADTPGAAWALARFAPDGTIAPPGGQGPLLAPLSPQALRLESAGADQIARLGLRTVGQLMDLPRAPLARRFGAAVLTRLDQALGREAEALSFRRPPNPWFARLAFAEPISAPQDMARVARDVAEKLCSRLEAEGRGARRFEVAFHRLDGAAPAIAVGLALPGRDPVRIGKLLAPKVEAVDPGFGVEVVTAWALDVEPIFGRQADLDRAHTAAAEDGLAPLVDRLANRLGTERVWRSRPVESHVPELSVGRMPALGAPALGAGRSDARPWDPEAPRPLRLFRRPEPVEQVVALTPDDPPRQFRWRGRLHRVRLAEGPERVAEEWWKGALADAHPAHVRDYYRLEDEAGGRFWLFRAGLYDPDEPAKWWMHGLFG